MENKYLWKDIKLGNDRYYFDGKSSFAKEVDCQYLAEVNDPKIISELEKKVGLNKIVSIKPTELKKNNYEAIASGN